MCEHVRQGWGATAAVSMASRQGGRNKARRRWKALALFACLGCSAVSGYGYSVQTHEQLVDLTWTTSIKPLLLRRFPGLTGDQLEEAHAFAYGGCAIQDLGYYPGGDALFSDLTHYVRAGDFIEALLRGARTPDDLAFAIGALSHYVGDTIGHSEATNPSVAEEFPQLGREYGPSVAYDKSPHAHVRTEFAFDINELAKRRFAPSAYLRHVGLNVPQDLLDRAFYETYGLHTREMLGPHAPAVRAYRFTVRSLLPRVAYAETLLHRGSLPPDIDDAEFEQLKHELAQADFENGWNAYRKKPGVGTYTLAGLIYLAPKFGPLSMLAIRGPNAEAEGRYVTSLNRTVRTLRQTVGALAEGSVPLPNRDLDTGQRVVPGGYRLTDQTYAALLQRITREPGSVLPAGLKQDVLDYYADPAAPISTRNNAKAWKQVQRELAVLRGMATRPEPV